MLPSLRRLSLGAPTGAPPVTTLEQDPFDLIVEKLVERVLEPPEDQEDEDGHSDAFLFNADKLCDKVTQVCNEVVTLERMSGNEAGVYDCSNPDSLVWKAAHSIFGVDALATFNHPTPERRVAPLTKLQGDTWRDSFRTLCKVFAVDGEYDVQYEVLAGQAGWMRHRVWVDLYRASSPEREGEASRMDTVSYEERARAAYRLKYGGMRRGDPGFVTWNAFRAGEGIKDWLQQVPEGVGDFRYEARRGVLIADELNPVIHQLERIISSVEYDWHKEMAGRILFTDTGPGTVKAQIIAFQKEMCQLGNLLYTQKRQDPKQWSASAANPFPQLWKRANEWEEENDDDEPATPDHVRNERMDGLDDEW